ncbi:MAG: hypothetical protein JRH20_13550 [Deltaproteobacteria bacterium]|nr:hypothetical protein [Deltaproteobacteria bacterium]
MRLQWSVVLLVATFFTSALAEAKSQKPSIIGSWEVVKWVKKDKEGKPPPGMHVRMTFKKDHTWQGELVHAGQKGDVKTGTWTLKGDRLVTYSKKKPKGDVLKVTFKGSSLELQKVGQPDTLIFKPLN